MYVAAGRDGTILSKCKMTPIKTVMMHLRGELARLKSEVFPLKRKMIPLENGTLLWRAEIPCCSTL